MGRSDSALLEKFVKLFRLFFADGEVTEIRALNLSGKGPWEGWARGQVSGYFDDVGKFAEAALRLEEQGRASGIYFIPNPVKPALLARAVNRLKVADVATTDKDIVCLRWLLIDTDAERPTGISATDGEEKAALEARDKVAAWLAERGWPAPITAWSGNGGHLLYRLPDLEPTQGNTDLLKRCLQALSAKFTTPAVKVDEKVFNPARIWKLYGTTARKGDHAPERPHRRSAIESLPEDLAAPVSLEQLNDLASMAPAPPAPAPRPRPPQNDQKRDLGRLDVAAYLNHCGIEFNAKDLPGRTLYRLSHCLFDSSHRKNEAAVVQDSEGMLTYQCFHDSCKGWAWKDAREKISGQDTIARFCQGYEEERRPAAPSKTPPAVGEDESPWRFFVKNERGKLVFKETLLVDEIIGKDGYLNVPGVGLYLWNGTVWKRTHEAYLKAKAKDLLGLEASRARVNSVAELIMNDTRVLLPHDRELNDIGDALNLLNGVLELDTWKLREPRREDFCTIQIQASFNPEARCPRWLQFWEEVRDGRSIELVKLAQEFSGYCLTRDNSHQKALIGVGPGQDGKSTWLNILEALLGEANVSNVAFPDLNDQFIRMQLHNKLLNWAGETEAEKALVSGWFKQIVGGDTIQASYKGQDPVSFKPFCKLIFLMNDYPRVRDVSFGFYRKLLVLPFRKQFLGEARDKHLFEKLKVELDGILNWALVGLERLRTQRDFTVGPESAEALELFQYENNPVRAFLEDCCVIKEDLQISRRALYQAYTQYSDEGGYRKYSKTEFYKRLRHLVPGFKEMRPRAGDSRPRQVSGLRLRDEFTPKDGQE